MSYKRKVLITGCTKGIGRATSELLLNYNYEVWGIGRSEERPLDHEFFHYFRVDLSDRDQISEFAIEVGGVNWYAIINNAGILIDDGEVLPRQVLIDTLDVNLLAPVTLTEALIDNVERLGKVILVTSNWGTFSDPNFGPSHPAYKISKAALNMYGKLLSERLRSRYVNVYNIDPGWVNTNMGGKGAPRDPEDVAFDILDFLQDERPTGKMWSYNQQRGW